MHVASALFGWRLPIGASANGSMSCGFKVFIFWARNVRQGLKCPPTSASPSAKRSLYLGTGVRPLATMHMCPGSDADQAGMATEPT